MTDDVEANWAEDEFTEPPVGGAEAAPSIHAEAEELMEVDGEKIERLKRNPPLDKTCRFLSEEECDKAGGCEPDEEPIVKSPNPPLDKTCPFNHIHKTEEERVNCNSPKQSAKDWLVQQRTPGQKLSQALGGAFESPETVLDQVKEKYFNSGYEAGKKDARTVGATGVGGVVHRTRFRKHPPTQGEWEAFGYDLETRGFAIDPSTGNCVIMASLFEKSQVVVVRADKLDHLKKMVSSAMGAVAESLWEDLEVKP
jgi:hypothetical protein